MIEDKDDGGASPFSHQIVDFTSAPASSQLLPSWNFPTHLLHYIVALDRESEARYNQRHCLLKSQVEYRDLVKYCDFFNTVSISVIPEP